VTSTSKAGSSVPVLTRQRHLWHNSGGKGSDLPGAIY
jgi:hypothetical protein